MQPVELRAYQESDNPAVVALWTSVFGYPAPHNDPRTIIQHKLALQRELFLVAVQPARLVGTVMGGYDGHRGWIYSLAVVPDLRRHGIGTMLVQRIERELQMLGCPKINLQILPSNAAVTAFYAKCGYAIEDRISMGKITGVAPHRS